MLRKEYVFPLPQLRAPMERRRVWESETMKNSMESRNYMEKALLE